MFRIFCIFFLKRAVLKYVPFFLCFLGRPERCTGWAHVQSVHAGAVQTHFCVFTFFSKIASRRLHFGSVLGAIFIKNTVLGGQKGFRKMVQKKYPPRRKLLPIRGSGASRTAPLACTFSEQEATVWARNNNSCSFLGPFLNPFLGIGYF